MLDCGPSGTKFCTPDIEYNKILTENETQCTGPHTDTLIKITCCPVSSNRHFLFKQSFHTSRIDEGGDETLYRN